MTEWPEGDNGRSGGGAPRPAGGVGAGGGGKGNEAMKGMRGRGKGKDKEKGARGTSAANQEMPSECQPIYSRSRCAPWRDLARWGKDTKRGQDGGIQGKGREEGKKRRGLAIEDEGIWLRRRRNEKGKGKRREEGSGNYQRHRTPQGNFKPEGRYTHGSQGRQSPFVQADKQADMQTSSEVASSGRQAACANRQAGK